MNKVFIEKVTGNLDLFTESCRVRGHSDLSIATQQMPMIRTYILFKDNVNIELYVLSFLPKYQRNVFASYTVDFYHWQVSQHSISGTLPKQWNWRWNSF